jgi:hypothetical protein
MFEPAEPARKGPAQNGGLPQESTSPTSRGAMAARICILLTLVCALTGAALAQHIQQGPKLVGSGASTYGYLGASVAVSADGNTAIVGAPTENNSSGGAWVFTRVNGVWSQQANFVGSDGVGTAQEQGYSVALSADGNTALVGGYGDNNDAGAGWVFTRSAGIWSQQAKIVGSGAAGTAGQGQSVALSADGNTAMLGGPGDNSSAGAAWVFTRSGNVWTQQGSKLVGTGAVGAASQGFSVALSSDGLEAIVGGPQDNNGAGAVWVFNSAGSWYQVGKLVGANGSSKAGQGQSVALSADGNTALLGGSFDSSGVGAAWVFVFEFPKGWQQSGGKLVGWGAAGYANQGSRVALSSDGNMALVGGLADNSGVGAAWVYTRPGGVWTQQGGKLVGTGFVTGGIAIQQGSAVALSGNGSTAIVAGPGDNNGTGAVWVFASPSRIGTYNAGQWYLDVNASGSWEGDPPDVSGAFGTGLPGAIYVTGDWNGDGIQKMGVFYQGFWYLDFKGDGTWDGGVVDKQYNFGWNDPNVIPVVGDWNGDGRTKIGVYYQGFWYLDYDGNGVWDGGVNDKQYNFGWPATGVTPMVGDWSATGTAKIGIYYEGFWYLDYDGNGVWNPANDKAYNFGWNATGVTPILGDWNGDQRAKIGIYYQGFWYLDYDGNGVWDGGIHDKQYNFGWPSTAVKPVIGDWNGGGTANIGIFYNGYWYLDLLGNGVWDGGFTDKAYVWGQAGDTPIVGKW